MAVSPPIKLAVVTGGKTHDVIGFQRLFRSLDGIDAYVQHIDDFAAEQESIRDAYDAVLFYLMMLDGPTDDGLPAYCGRPKAALKRLGQTGQGIVLLHHAILAYPDWPIWDDMVGMTQRTIAGYSHDETLNIRVTDAAHPIMQGLDDWTMIDETYNMHNPEINNQEIGYGVSNNQVLLTVEHIDSMSTVAWTRRHRHSRVFCLQLGHDSQSWIDPNFQAALARGIRWCADRL